MKKILSMVLAVSVVFGTAAPNAAAADSSAVSAKTDYQAGDYFTEGDLGYKVLEDGTLEVSAYDWYITVADIPSSINGMKVTSIGRNAFSSCISLTSVTIPDGITSIDNGAFRNCTSLTSATIPDSVTSIGNYAFQGCESLTSVTIPDSVTSIGDYAFGVCTSLTAINVGKENKNYCSENGILFNKDETTLITYPAGKTDNFYAIPDSVTSIGNYAFSYCASLTSVAIPDSVASIGDYAFGGCASLTSVTIPDSVTSIGDYAFGGCTSLTSVTIPDSVTSIGDYAFWGCTSLTSVTIPDSVTNIGNEAFFGCTSLTSVTIPDSVTDIGRVAFADCTSLTSVTIPGSVTSMGELAFCDCTSLTSVIISDGVTSIGDDAFSGCTSLTSVTIPDSVKRIGYGTFKDCTSLTSVTIPDSVTSINNYAFSSCTSLTSVTIPDSVTSINNYAFSSCTSLTAINVGKGNKNYCSENGVLFNKDKTTLITYPAGKTDNSYAIPDSVTDIGWGAFEGCTSLTSVTILDGVTSIDGFAFSGCTSLTAINVGKENKNYCSENGVLFNKDKTTLITYPAGKTDNFYVIPEGVTSIGEKAFRGCASLTSVIIPDSVTSIDWDTFYGFTSLTSVTIPDSVESIAEYAFSGCVCLKDIYYSGTAEEWSEIYIAFFGNEPLSTATIHYNSIGPDSVQIEISKPENSNAPDTSGMKVEIAGGEKPQTITISADGKLDLSGIADGKYSFTFSANNCAPRKYSVTVLNGTASGIDSSVELHLYGDVNGDRKINGTDVLKAKLHAKGSQKLSGYDLSVADVTKDGKINGTDVLKLKLHAKGSTKLW